MAKDFTNIVSLKGLQRFSKSWDTDKIILFTKIMVLGSQKGRVIQMGRTGLMMEFRWTRTRVENTVAFFIDLGFITQLPTGVKQLNKYQINVDAVVSSVEKIFDLDKYEDPDQRSKRKLRYETQIRHKLNAAYMNQRFRGENSLKLDESPGEEDVLRLESPGKS